MTTKQSVFARWAKVAIAVIALISGSVQARTYKVLYSFQNFSDGESAYGGLVMDSSGSLYGTTYYGGGNGCINGLGCGTIFKVDPSGNESVLYSFQGGLDGAQPVAGLVQDAVGNFYGTTSQGGGVGCGGVGCGTVFELDVNGTETVLYHFAGGSDGAIPHSNLIMDSSGNLYGTTTAGGGLGACVYTGVTGCGTVIKLDTAGMETVLHSFAGGTDGANPEVGLFRDTAGNILGVTDFGGGTRCHGSGCGVIFELDASNNETILYSFLGGKDGAFPAGALTRDSAGNFYGVTLQGGRFKCQKGGCGTVFELSAAGKESVLYTFYGGKRNGVYPSGTLAMDSTGNLYGSTFFGGRCGGRAGCGTIFRLSSGKKGTLLYRFTGDSGAYPYGGVITAPGGALYGATVGGGAHAGGVVFELAP